jgi:hypothetical protein
LCWYQTKENRLSECHQESAYMLGLLDDITIGAGKLWGARAVLLICHVRHSRADSDAQVRVLIAYDYKPPQDSRKSLSSTQLVEGRFFQEVVPLTCSDRVLTLGLVHLLQDSLHLVPQREVVLFDEKKARIKVGPPA